MSRERLIIFILSILLFVISLSFSAYVLYQNDKNFRNFLNSILVQDLRLTNVIKYTEVYSYRIYGNTNSEFVYSVILQEDKFFLLGLREDVNKKGLLLSVDLSGNLSFDKDFGLRNSDILFLNGIVKTNKDIVIGSEFVSREVDFGKGDIWLLFFTNSTNIAYDLLLGGEDSENSPTVRDLKNGDLVFAFMTKSFNTNSPTIAVAKIISNDLREIKVLKNLVKDTPITILDLGSNYWVVGETKSFGEGESDVIIIAFDYSDNLIWAKTLGTKRTDTPISGVVQEDGVWLLVASSIFNLVKLDFNGNLILSKRIKYGYPTCLHKSEEGLIVSGSFSSKELPYNIFLIKTDTNLNVIWQDFFTFTYEETPVGIFESKNFLYLFGNSSSEISKEDIWLTMIKEIKLVSNSNDLTNAFASIREPLVDSTDKLVVSNIAAEFITIPISATNKNVFQVKSIYSLLPNMAERFKREKEELQKLEKIKKKTKKKSKKK